MIDSTPAFRARIKFRRPRLSRYRKEGDLSNYQRFYNAHTRPSSGTQLSGSIIDGIAWSSWQKEHYFRALARYGKSRLDEVARESGKSLLECAAYLHTLQTALTELQSHAPDGCISYRDLPCAIEVDQTTLAREEDLSASLAEKAASQYHETQSRIGWSIITSKEADEIEAMMTDLSAEQKELFWRSAPDLSTFCYAFTETDTGIYKSASEALYAIYTDYLVRVMQCSHDIAVRRRHVQRGQYFEEKRYRDGDGVNNRDVRAALAVLFPRTSDYNHFDDSSSDGTRDGSESSTSEEQDSQLSRSDHHEDVLMSDTTENQGTGGINEVPDSQQMHDQEIEGQGNQDDDEETEEFEDELDELLDRHDAHIAVVAENEYRAFLNLAPRLLPESLTASEQKRLNKLLKEERTVEYDTNDDRLS